MSDGKHPVNNAILTRLFRAVNGERQNAFCCEKRKIIMIAYLATKKRFMEWQI